MIGSRGERMLRMTLPYVDIWNAWLSGSRSNADQVPPMRTQVDAACADVGRDPATLARSVSVMIDMNGRREIGPSMKPDAAEPLSGSAEEIAAGLRAFADEGISHIQAYLVPNTIQSVEAFAGVLQLIGNQDSGTAGI